MYVISYMCPLMDSLGDARIDPPKQYDQLNTCTAADKKESASIVRRRDEVQWQKAQK
ncbi:hypothetical protein Plhal304r1_c044g0124351 [Plasmopara halstedii]